MLWILIYVCRSILYHYNVDSKILSKSLHLPSLMQSVPLLLYWCFILYMPVICYTSYMLYYILHMGLLSYNLLFWYSMIQRLTSFLHQALAEVLQFDAFQLLNSLARNSRVDHLFLPSFKKNFWRLVWGFLN